MSALSEHQTSPLTPPGKNLALLLLAMTQFVIVIDASIVNVALPSIGRALNFSRTDLSWVVNAYVLTFGGSYFWAAGWPTCSGAGACSWSASCCSRSPRWPADWRNRSHGSSPPAPRRASEPRSSRPPHCRSSRPLSPRVPSATARSASGAPSPALEAQPGSCSAASLPAD